MGAVRTGNIRIPMMFTRHYACTAENGRKPNTEDRRTEKGHPLRISYVVMLPTYNDGKIYDSRWMDNPNLITDHKVGDMIIVADVDIVDYEKDIHVFDLDDSEEAYNQALAKMKELWAAV